MSEVDIHHLGAAYALDALDQHERTTFEAHYTTCEVCNADVSEFRATITHLAEASSTTPPAGLKAKVMADIAQTRQVSPLLRAAVTDLAERRRRRQRWVGAGLAVAAAVVAIVAGTLVIDRSSQPGYAADLASVLGQDDARFVSLHSTDASDIGASVKVAWSQDIDAAVLLADGLPVAPDGQAYELWLIGADGPIPMSVLDAADDGQVREVLEIATAPHAWGVTVEPAAGSPTPTGPILYLAEV